MKRLTSLTAIIFVLLIAGSAQSQTTLFSIDNDTPTTILKVDNPPGGSPLTIYTRPV